MRGLCILVPTVCIPQGTPAPPLKYFCIKYFQYHNNVPMLITQPAVVQYRANLVKT